MTDKTRELLESVVEHWGIQAYPHDWEKLVREIRSYLADTNPSETELVGNTDTLDIEKYATGLIGFIQYVPDAGMNFTLDEPDDDTYPFDPVYVRPAPRKPFVRLSEEEVSQILSSAHTPYEAICAVENRLVEKNS